MMDGNQKNKELEQIGKPLLESELKLFQHFFDDKFNGQMLSLDAISACWHKYNNGIWRVEENGQLSQLWI